MHSPRLSVCPGQNSDLGGFGSYLPHPAHGKRKLLKRGVSAHYSYFFFSDCLGVVAPTFDVDFNIYCTSLGRFANPSFEAGGKPKQQGGVGCGRGLLERG